MKIQIKKQTKLILLGMILVLMIVGTTFAWWIANSNVEKQITMGEMKITATLNDKTQAQNYEPGDSYETEGVIKNEGSISAMIKFTSNSKIKFSDSEIFVSLDKDAVKVAMSRAANPGDGYWYTAEDEGTYLALDPGESANIKLKVAFVGENLGNNYMNSVVKADANLKATQIYEGAILSEFEVDPSSFTDLPVSQNLARRSGITPAMEYLQNKLNRGK